MRGGKLIKMKTEKDGDVKEVGKRVEEVKDEGG